MAALAEEAGKAGSNFESWHALQVWLECAEHRVWIPYAKQLAGLVPPVAVRLRRDFGALLNLIRAHALLHQATRERDGEGRIVATIEEDYAAVRKLVVDLVGEGVETTVPATVRETVEAVKWLRESSKGEPVTVAELARKLQLDRSTLSRRARSAKDHGYLRDLEDNPRKPSRLVLGDDLPDDVQILPSPDDVRAGMQERVSSNARPDGAQEPHRNGQYSDDAYKACNRARVQEGIKYPPPPSGSEPGDTDNHQDDIIIDEVRDLFASDALEEV
jgi:DNA-binding transcriptional ArsR family regulator